MSDQIMLGDPILEKYLDRICVEYGFCLPPQKKERLLRSSITSATTFVRKVMEEEGLRDDEADIHFEALHKLLLEMLGSEQIRKT